MKYASVTDVVRRIKTDIEKDYRLQSIAMEGNIMGLKRASNGHYYMTLCDDHCSIRAILFRNRAGRSMVHVQDGDHVVVIGAINVYEKGGTVSFIIERLFSQGIGSLQAQYEKIKRELEEQGFFSPAHKKEIPRFPWHVGVLTSRTGAVLHDIHKIAAERNPYIPIQLYPIPVQGTDAASKITAAIEKASKNPKLDVLILARGGGSLEDLWCFNDPQVVKAVYQSAIPIISAIGHETDTTLADYAADVRAATPTHAAELAFPSMQDIEMDLAAYCQRAYELLEVHIAQCRKQIDAIQARIQPQRYAAFLSLKQGQVSQLREAALQKIKLAITKKEAVLREKQASLEAMNPSALVRRGYGQLEQSGRIITQIAQIQTDEALYIQLVDGRVKTDVKEVDIYGKSNRQTKKL